MNIGIDIDREKPMATIAALDQHYRLIALRQVSCNYYTGLPHQINVALSEIDPEWPHTRMTAYMDTDDIAFLNEQGVCFCCLTQTCPCECHG